MTTTGDLKWRVRFDRQVEQADPAGGSVAVWREQFSRAAEIVALSGTEPVVAQRLTGRQPYRVRVRFDSMTRTIQASWRCVEMLNNVPVMYMAIKAPPEDMDRERKFITILAVSGEADGGSGP